MTEQLRRIRVLRMHYKRQITEGEAAKIRETATAALGDSFRVLITCGPEKPEIEIH